ncbi:EcsC family protein [Rhabdobacter roseus]|uniref:EcsC family protein n=1 Tax=Rhabdobacter roseus TaxID=1655419 RepID=A0A840TQE9_9BACT|nr:EcsC family protein [Rhabdobacter roseus]MBB5283937.1 hypothetical protein [Rhabdobacter roseus]
MRTYEDTVSRELRQWQIKMQKPPSLGNKVAKNVQTRLNRLIPDKVHQAVTATIKQMTRAVLFGSEFTTRKKEQYRSLAMREAVVKERINFYKKTGAVEGGVTGAGGFWLAMADFPILLGIKMKMLFEIASHYGHDVEDYRERLYILHIFQLAFSSQERRKEVYQQMVGWDKKCAELPPDIDQFDWYQFQQEYRDYIDLAKMAQLLPGVGAAVGLVVNYRLIQRLGETAMYAYRMRLADRALLPATPSLPEH